MTREEHLQWSKDRALKLLESGNINEAFTSMQSDVVRHNELQCHVGTNMLGVQLLIGGHLSTVQQMRDWINGYN